MINLVKHFSIILKKIKKNQYLITQFVDRKKVQNRMNLNKVSNKMQNIAYSIFVSTIA
jgi:hypothetical protein